MGYIYMKLFIPSALVHMHTHDGTFMHMHTSRERTDRLNEDMVHKETQKYIKSVQ